MIGNKIETNIAGGLDISLPRMVEVRQKFKTEKLASVTATINEQVKRPEIRAKIKPGMSIAVGCGSRGIKHIAEAAKATVDNLKALGAKPFIFPPWQPRRQHGGSATRGAGRLWHYRRILWLRDSVLDGGHRSRHASQRHSDLSRQTCQRSGRYCAGVSH